MKHLVLLAAIPALAGCPGGNAKKAPSDPGKVAKLEARLDAMNQRLARIERLLKDSLDRPPEPDASATYAMPVFDSDPYIGPEHARVTLVKAYEFACPFCEQVRSTLDQLRKDYKGKLKVVYKYFVVHNVAIPAGLAACAANKQGKFAVMKELIWEKGFKEGDIGPEKLEALAKDAGLDVTTFKSDMRSDSCIDSLKRSQKVLVQFGTTGTPAFYINGRFLSGAQPIENFKKLIDEELAKADKIIRGGVPEASYYRTVVIGKGLKKVE